MRLYLVRHGKAMDVTRDTERPLSEVGRDEVGRVAAFLEEHGVRVARVAHSGKARAAQTAEILAAAVAPDTGTEETDGLMPGDPVEPVARAAARWTQDTMLVGHLPFMALLASLLLSGDQETVGVRYRPGTVVCLHKDGGALWSLAWAVQPVLLARP
jgi:phosphohistidine phosphatase